MVSSERFKWVAYNFLTGFAVYWASNLFLWFPWSIHPLFGMILMLTVSPLLWGYASYSCLRTYPGQKKLLPASVNAMIFLGLAVVLDYVFFGLIRNALEQLYHPTTFYGYGFVICLPFIVTFFFRRNLANTRRSVRKDDFYNIGITGLICLGLLVLLILLGWG